MKSQTKSFTKSNKKSRTKSYSRKTHSTKTSKNLNISNKFLQQLMKIYMTPNEYLKKAKLAAKKRGYNPKLLTFANNSVHKLEYDGVKFGRVGYGDFIIWTHNEKRGVVSPGYAKMKRNVFTRSHSAIKGSWKNNLKSPNNLAIHILW
jgi:hypothetical protein